MTLEKSAAEILNAQAGAWQKDQTIEYPAVEAVVTRVIGCGDYARYKILLVRLCDTFNAKVIFPSDGITCKQSGPLR